MGQPSMRITVDAAMRARDVARERPAAGEPASARAAEPPRRTKAQKNERRRLGKRGGAQRNP
ncbi:hypothetical protein [Spirillospora albida]|uniref:hypothetical protein n=1 Tax=Spirillospora albida TaxID=58123 RepID=UPI0012FBDD08|nr:hypothetical protein [Spirillospora albida]